MKKLIAVLIALAMVLSMSVMSFAAFGSIKSPADIVKEYGSGETDLEGFFNKCISLEDWQLSDYGNWWNYIDANNAIRSQGIYTKSDDTLMNWDEAWAAYYACLVGGITSDPTGAIGEIVGSVQDGYVEAGDAIKMVGDAAMGGAGGDGGAGDLSGVIDEIIGAIGGGGEEAQPEISTEAYVEELKALINSGADFETVTTKISGDLESGKIVVSQLPDIAKGLTDLIDAGEIENNETVQQILEFINGIGGGSGEGVTFPDFGDITLPGDEGNSESGSFLDTILGIIGSIGDIFNPDAGDEPTPDDPADPGTTDTPTEIPDTGDVSFVAVAAVAAVAGVALVLTRKKHNDAE